MTKESIEEGNNLSEILQQSISLTNTQQNILTSIDASLLQLTRPLDQLEEQSKKLWQKSSRNRDAVSDTRAQVLLAGQGFDVEKISQTLQAIQVAQTFEPSEPIEDTDIEGYLRHEQEIVMLKCMEKVKTRVMKEYKQKFERLVANEWEKSKNSIFELISHPTVMNTFTPKQQQTTDLRIKDGEGLINQMNAYAKVVVQLNEYRLQNKSPLLARMFKECSINNNNNNNKSTIDQLQSFWDILSTIIGETTTTVGGGIDNNETPLSRKLSAKPREIVGEECFMNAYNAEYNSRENIQLRKRLLNGSRRYLEQLFYSFLTNLNNGKQPIVSRVQQWTREILQINNNSLYEIVDGNAFWAIVYYLIRLGRKREALDYAAKYEKYLQKTEKKFLDYLTAWVTNEDLPRKLQQDLMNDFNSRLREASMRQQQQQQQNDYYYSVGSSSSSSSMITIDPYKYLIYRLIGRILLDDTRIPPMVVKGLAGGRLGWEDDLWLQLMFCREQQEQQQMAGVDLYTMKDLNERFIKQISQNEWTIDGRNPMRFANVLLLCGEFEQCILFLQQQQQQQQYIVYSVHLAICLNYYGLMKIQNSIFSRVDFSRLLQNYLNKLYNQNINYIEAANYIILLKDLKLLIDLVLSTGRIDEFFGTVGKERLRRPGYLERFNPLIGINSWEEFQQRLLKPAAQKCNNEHYSIMLYNLANDYSSVLLILSRRLSLILRDDLNIEQLVDLIITNNNNNNNNNNTINVEFIKIFLEKLSLQQDSCRQVLDYYSNVVLNNHELVCLKSLVELGEFYKILLNTCLQYLSNNNNNHHSEWHKGIQIVESVGLLPNGFTQQLTSIDYTSLMSKAENLRREFNDLILTLLPSVLIGVELLLYCSNNVNTSSSKSKQLLTFTSLLNKWFKLTPIQHQYLNKIDELIITINNYNKSRQ